MRISVSQLPGDEAASADTREQFILKVEEQHGARKHETKAASVLRQRIISQKSHLNKENVCLKNIINTI